MKRAAIIIATLAALLFIIRQITRAPDAPQAPSPAATASQPQTQNSKPKTSSNSNSSGSSAVTSAASASERSPLADALNSPATDIQADLRLVSGIVDTFRTNFLQTGNPTGTNAEITAALTGRNAHRLSLIPPDHPAIDKKTGELCDRWGTPFFFHAESATRLEIRSAGPDKKMWSPDDISFAP